MLKIFEAIKNVTIALTFFALAATMDGNSYVMRVLTANYSLPLYTFQIGFVVGGLLYLLVALNKAKPNYSFASFFYMYTAGAVVAWAEGVIPLAAVVVYVSYALTLFLNVTIYQVRG